MDRIPHEFVDKVFTLLQNHRNPKFQPLSSVWNDCARVHTKKRRYFVFDLWVTRRGGLKYQLKCSKDQLYFKFDDVLRMDHRFNRITEFSLHPFFGSDDMMDDLAVERLPELVDFLSYCQLNCVIIDRFDELDSLREPLGDLLANVKLRTFWLKIRYSPELEQFLANQLKNDHLRVLTLLGTWSSKLQDNIEAFVCRPNYWALSSDYECLDTDAYKRFLAYWKAQGRVSKWSSICMASRSLYDEYLTWMASIGEEVEDERVHRPADHKILVDKGVAAFLLALLVAIIAFVCAMLF